MSEKNTVLAKTDKPLIVKKCACPHCGEFGILFVRKMFFFAVLSETCESCGNKVKFPYWSIWSMLSLIPLLLITMLPMVINEPVDIALNAMLLTAFSLLIWELIPLKKK